MKWENLQTFQCPHCDEPLQNGETADAEITCTSCSFHLPRRRFESILEHRARPTSGPIIKFKWQVLHDQRCPMCQNMLKPEERNALILKCLTSTCSFRIHENRLREIMADPEHPVNRFKNRQ